MDEEIDSKRGGRSRFEQNLETDVGSNSARAHLDRFFLVIGTFLRVLRPLSPSRQSFPPFPAFLRLLLHFAVSEFLTSFVDELDGLELFDGRVDAENPAPPGGRVEKLVYITSLV